VAEEVPVVSPEGRAANCLEVAFNYVCRFVSVDVAATIAQQVILSALENKARAEAASKGKV
jgi:hypothetical protein